MEEEESGIFARSFESLTSTEKKNQPIFGRSFDDLDNQEKRKNENENEKHQEEIILESTNNDSNEKNETWGLVGFTRLI